MLYSSSWKNLIFLSAELWVNSPLVARIPHVTAMLAINAFVVATVCGNRQILQARG